MPEGDTIRLLADRLAPAAVGHAVSRSVVRHNRYAGADLAGTRVEEIDAAGKHLLIRLGSPEGHGWVVHSHLRMSGRWTLGVPPRTPAWRRRIELHLDGARPLVGTDLPVLHIARAGEERRWIGHLGPDLCAPAFDAATATANLAADGAAPLGGALLDQRRLAGIGNLYAVEIPFLVGVSPWTPIGDVTGPGDLVALARALLPANVEVRDQTTTGRRGRAVRHWVYGRTGRACPVCATTIRGAGEREVPWGRVTRWCTTCQAGTAVDLDRARRLLRAHAVALRHLDAAGRTRGG